jgi:ADP-ribose pyrophosphatase YjhB (NUDIX family)
MTEVVALPRIDYFNDPAAPPANSIVVATTVYLEDEYGRVLLVRRADSDTWAMPGGGLEVGETVTGCGIRETREETGLHIEITGVVGIFSNPAHVIAYPDGEVRQQFSICLRGQVVGGQIRTSEESKEVRWVHESQFARLDMHPEMRRRIDRAMMHDATAYVD